MNLHQNTKTRTQGTLIVIVCLLLITAPFIDFVGRLANILFLLTGAATLTFFFITGIYAIITGRWPK